MSVGEAIERKERPAYVRYERRPVEDRNASAQQGRYVANDVDFALVTPPYSRDVFEQKAADWHAEMRRQVGFNRLPQEWYDSYIEQFEKWKKGEEIPLNGTAIKSWGVLSPAQQKMLVEINIRTVEDLALVNDEGCRRIGIGGGELRDKAKAWLSQLADKGPLTQENSSLKAENAALIKDVATLRSKVEELTARLEIQTMGTLTSEHFARPAPETISVDDIMPDEQITVAEVVPLAAAQTRQSASVSGPDAPPAAVPVKRHRRTKLEMQAARAAEAPQPVVDQL